MKKAVLKYGLISGGIMLGSFTLLIATTEMTESLGYDLGEIIGYTSMIIATSIVFFGIKHYRDNENGGLITFGKGMAIGMLIVLFPSVLFGAADVFYTTVINPEWIDNYYSTYVAEMQASMPADEFEIALAKMESEKEMFSNPFMHFLVMSVTVLMIGAITTIISALALKKG